MSPECSAQSPQSPSAKLTLDVRTSDGKTDGTVELPAAIFDAPANIALMHQVVTAQLAGGTPGQHSTKNAWRRERGGAKPYPPEGHRSRPPGSTRAPQFTGGGTVHGPQPRDFSQRTPKKMKAAALRGALSDGHATRHPRRVRARRGADPVDEVARRFLELLSERRKFLVVLAVRNSPRRRASRTCPTCCRSARTSSTPTTSSTPDDIVFSVEALKHLRRTGHGRAAAKEA